MDIIIYIKKAAVNVILTAVFCLLVVVLVRPLLAELSFNSAEKLVKGYKWAPAAEKFQEAIRFDPFNARYFSGLGNFFMLEAKYRDNKTPALMAAKRCYERALALNPRDAESCLQLGLIALRDRSIDAAFAYFRKAVQNDPNGFNIAYPIGFTGVGFWKHLDAEDREFVVNRLRFSLIAMPWYANRIYDKAWKSAGDFKILQKIAPDTLNAQRDLYGFLAANNLWQFRREQAAKIDSYKSDAAANDRGEIARKVKDAILNAEKLAEANVWRQIDGKWQMIPGGEKIIERNKAKAGRRKQGVIVPADWIVFTNGGKGVKGNGGALYSNGTMYALIEVPDGKPVIKVTARGAATGRVWPYMIIGIDGEEVGEMFVDSAEAKEHDFSLDTTGGLHVLSVTFVNDLSKNGEDRNLFVENVRVVK